MSPPPTVQRLSPKTHRPRSPRQSAIGGGSTAPPLNSPQAGSTTPESVTVPVPTGSPTTASPATNRAVTPSCEGTLFLVHDEKGGV